MQAVGYAPTEGQAPIHRSEARLRLVAGGERAGKSRSTSADVFAEAIEVAERVAAKIKASRVPGKMQWPPVGTGQLPTEIDWERVAYLAHIGCTQEEIAADIGLSLGQLRLREEFAEIYERNVHLGRIRIREAMYNLADKGNVTMLVWLSKNRLGYSDRSEVGGIPGKPLEIEIIWPEVAAGE